MLLWNILLAFAWSALVGSFTLINLIVGFALGFLLLFLLSTRGVVGSTTYASRFGRAISFLIFFIRELIVANMRMAYDVLRVESNMRPGIVAVPLDAETDLEIMLLCNLITLTPGTLSMDVSSDRGTLYIHAMFIDNDDPDLFRRKLKEGFERRVLEVLR
jgi:multicomponent Na+:H+ antiporter subunit E